MITINTDRGLINVNSWDDVLTIAGYTPNLDPAEHELSSIIGRYLFRDRVHCGLSNCHTPHERGYVVTTKSGAVTNIGKDCGTKYFGVNFEDLSRKFDRDVNEKEMRERLSTFAFGIEELEDKLHQIRNAPHGADWINKRVSNLQTRGGNVPDDVIRRLAEMVRTGSGVLTKPREASSEEIEALRATGARIAKPHYIEEPVGDIEGFEALYPEFNLRKLLVLNIDEKLRDFKKLNEDTMTYEQLKYWTKWIGSIDNTIDTVIEAINHGQRLLTNDNLMQFNKVLTRADIDLFRGFLKTL